MSSEAHEPLQHVAVFLQSRSILVFLGPLHSLSSHPWGHSPISAVPRSGSVTVPFAIPVKSLYILRRIRSLVGWLAFRMLNSRTLLFWPGEYTTDIPDVGTRKSVYLWRQLRPKISGWMSCKFLIQSQAHSISVILRGCISILSTDAATKVYLQHTM